jgi:hypothetical protein
MYFTLKLIIHLEFYHAQKNLKGGNLKDYIRLKSKIVKVKKYDIFKMNGTSSFHESK